MKYESTFIFGKVNPERCWMAEYLHSLSQTTGTVHISDIGGQYLLYSMRHWCRVFCYVLLHVFIFSTSVPRAVYDDHTYTTSMLYVFICLFLLRICIPFPFTIRALVCQTLSFSCLRFGLTYSRRHSYLFVSQVRSPPRCAPSFSWRAYISTRVPLFTCAEMVTRAGRFLRVNVCRKNMYLGGGWKSQNRPHR